MAVEVVVPTRGEPPPGDDEAAAPRAAQPTADKSVSRSGPRWLLPTLLIAGIVALLACLLAGGTVGTGAVSGLPDAGTGTRWALPLASFIAETAAVLAFGAALLAGALLPSRHPEGDTAKLRTLSTAKMLSWLAAGATVVVFVLTLSDLTARPLPQALELDEALQLASFGPGRLLLIAAAMSLLGGAIAARTGRRLRRGQTDQWKHLILLIAVLAGALVTWALGGHATQSGQDIASSSMIVHVLAAGAWVGGLVVVVLHVRGALLTTVLPRFSTLALWCWVAIGISGVITGWLRLGSLGDLWTSNYGRLLLVKLMLLGVLGGFGVWHRRRMSTGLANQSIGERHALLRIAAVEVLVMGATMGVATALSGTAPAAGHAVGHDLVHGTSRIESMVGHKLPVISTQNLLVLWRPDVIVLLLIAVLLAGYLVGVRRSAGAGLAWPLGRTCWAVAAAGAAVLVLNSGVASYVNAVWSVTVTQQAMTSMVIPLAITLARPWELCQRSGSTIRRGMAGMTARPGLVIAGYLAWSAVVLLTPVALWSVSNHALLMFTRLGDVAVGVALFAVLLPTRSAAVTDHSAGRFRWLIFFLAGETALTWILAAGGAAASRPWFAQLNIAWITAAQDERTAATLRFAVVVLVFVVVAVVNLTPTRHPSGVAGTPESASV
jgi:putative copper resistance protein D